MPFRSNCIATLALVASLRYKDNMLVARNLVVTGIKVQHRAGKRKGRPKLG